MTGRRWMVGLALSLAMATVGCEEDKKPAADAAATATATASAAATGKATAEAAAATAGASEGTARSHMPAGCQVAARVDLKKLLEHESVSKVVVPALQKMQKEPKDPDQKKAVAALDAMGVDLSKDVHEVALCVTDVMKAKGSDPPPFVLLVSGNIKKDSLVPAVMDQKAEVTETQLAGIKTAADEKKEMYMGQASDGVVLFAHGKANYEKAVSAKGEGIEEHSIPLDKSSVVVIDGSVIQEALAEEKQNPFQAHTPNIEALAVYWDIENLKTDLRARMKNEKAAIEFAGALKMVMTEMTKQQPNPRSPFAPVAELLKDAKVDSEGKETVISVTMPKEKMDELLAKMSKEL